jgi:DNA primase
MNDKPDITAVLEYYGATVPTRSGWAKMKCPFHDDSHASAGVNHEEDVFNCLACEISGDIYNIIQKIEKVDFREAKSRAKEIVGEGIKPLRTERRVGRIIPKESGSIAGRRKASSPWGGEQTSRRARNV